MNKADLVKAAAVAALAVGLSSAAITAQAAPKMEKCAGIVKKGMNDCGTAAHPCAGQASRDNEASEWIFMPEGLCGKITGGKVKGK